MGSGAVVREGEQHRPLAWIATGYLVTGLYARVHGYDLLADPLGWLLVLSGLRRLPVDAPATRGTAFLAAALSVPLWVPAVTGAVDDADSSLGWALSLPALAFVALLCHRLAGAAREAGERTAPQVLSGLVTVSVVVAVLPVLVFGGHVTALDGPADAVGSLLPLAFFAVLVRYAPRPWAGAPIPETPTEGARGS